MSSLYACIISDSAKQDEAILTAIARGFAYRVELLEDGVLFDVSGLEKLIGDEKTVSHKILNELKEHNIPGSIAVAKTIDSALLLARQNEGLTHTVSSAEKFQQLLLRNLDIDPDTIGVFQALGITRIEELEQVPHDDLVARYGQNFRSIIDVIGQKTRRTITPNIKEKNVSWAFELDHPVEEFGQLIFIANRALDELLDHTAQQAMSTEQIDIHFKLENDGSGPGREPRNRSYEIKSSFPTLDKSFWLKLINLRISIDPPEAAIVSVKIVSHFTRPRPTQSGLYAVSRPQPENLLLTIGKIKKLVGENNVGVPVLLEKRLERAFSLDADRLPSGKEQAAASVPAPVIAFNYFDPPIPAEILVRNRQLVYMRTKFFSGRVLACSGVWRLSSKWWEKMWDTEEWHVEIEDAGVYRLQKHGEDWSVVGEFD